MNVKMIFSLSIVLMNLQGADIKRERVHSVRVIPKDTLGQVVSRTMICAGIGVGLTLGWPKFESYIKYTVESCVDGLYNYLLTIDKTQIRQTLAVASIVCAGILVRQIHRLRTWYKVKKLSTELQNTYPCHVLSKIIAQDLDAILSGQLSEDFKKNLENIIRNPGCPEHIEKYINTWLEYRAQLVEVFTLLEKKQDYFKDFLMRILPFILSHAEQKQHNEKITALYNRYSQALASRNIIISNI